MSYLCKPEHTMSEIMKKASKQAYERDIKGKSVSIGNTYLTKRKVSAHEEFKRVLSLCGFKYRCSLCSYQSKKNGTGMLKSISFRKDAS